MIDDLPRLARYLQAVFIVTNSFGRLNKLELESVSLFKAERNTKYFENSTRHF